MPRQTASSSSGRDRVNLGIAVYVEGKTARGPQVPNIKDAVSLNFAVLEAFDDIVPARAATS